MQGYGNVPEGTEHMASAPWNEPDKEKEMVLVKCIVGIETEFFVQSDYTTSDLYKEAKEKFSDFVGEFLPDQISFVEEV